MTNTKKSNNSNIRKIKTPGINPSSYIIHPATLKFIKKNQDKEKITAHPTNDYSQVMLIPKISFTYEEILNFYKIKYIQDLDNNLHTFPKSTKIRLIDLYFKYNKSIKHFKQLDIKNIYNFLEKEFNLSSQQIYKNLTKLKEDSFKNIFY